MAHWEASTEQHLFLGSYSDKNKMFDAMRLRGVGSKFRARGSTGSEFLYEVTPYGYSRLEASVPEKMRRDGRKVR